uniref:FBD-associated F-box protein At1g66320-like n=1 Tax=Nicotiana sylvestris TaxID=4096 RepID=A0A1U7XA64_NICSY
LRHLTLETCLIELLPPAFKGFDRLMRLELRYVTISSELLGSLISRCLLLEHLVLENIRVSTSNIIEINAPRLRSFDYGGNTRPLFFKDIPRLAKLSFNDCQYFVRAGKINIAKFLNPFLLLSISTWTSLVS